MARSNTVSPNALAATLSKRLGRTITAKMVRQTARETLAAFDKVRHPAYQSHEYTADMVRRITDVFVARGQRSRVQPKRATPKRTAAPKRAARKVETPDA